MKMLPSAGNGRFRRRFLNSSRELQLGRNPNELLLFGGAEPFPLPYFRAANVILSPAVPKCPEMPAPVRLCKEFLIVDYLTHFRIFLTVSMALSYTVLR